MKAPPQVILDAQPARIVVEDLTAPAALVWLLAGADLTAVDHIRHER
jgi:hypothetical protein